MKRSLLFIIIALPLLMMAIDWTIVTIALHALQHDLHTTVNWVSWVVTAFSFGYVIALPLSSYLCARYGHYKVFMASVMIFTLASLFCGLVSSIGWMILWRIIQAIGAAGLMPAATQIVVNHFGKDRDLGVSLLGSVYFIGAMLGPALGGFFLYFWSWRGIFLVNVPVGLMVLLLAFMYVPRDKQLSLLKDEKIDISGMIILSVGLLAGMYALTVIGDEGTHWWSLTFIVPLMASVVLIRYFFQHIRRVERPLIAVWLIAGNGFGAVNLINMIYGGLVYGGITLIPLYAALHYGIKGFAVSILLLIQGLATLVFSISGVLTLRYTGYRLPLFIATSITALGLLFFGLNPLFDLSPYAWLCVAAVLVGAGAGVMNPPSRSAGLHLAPGETATITAMRSLFVDAGYIIFMSVATSVLAIAQGDLQIQSLIYIVSAGLMVVTLPLAIMRVPNHYGTW